jgi:sulfite reductase alpha subunit-like flavoprotein
MPEGSLAQLRFGVFGLGNKNTRHDFNNAAKVRMRLSTELPGSSTTTSTDTHALPHYTTPHATT